MTNSTVSKPIFKRIEVKVAIISAILPFVITYLINYFGDDKKELTITYSQPEKMISEIDGITNELKIIYDSSNVRNISKMTLRIKNSGTTCLTKEDFIDGPINIYLTNKNHEKNVILQAFEKEDANQQNSDLKYKNQNSSISQVIYSPSLLNPNDEITIETYMLNSPDVKVSTKGKILDGNIYGPHLITTKEDKIGYKTFILSITSFFINKWLAIFFEVILILILSLTGIFLLAVSQEKEYQKAKPFLYTMIITMSLLVSLLIIVIVSTLLIV